MPDTTERPVFPLKGYRLMDYKADPTIVGIAFDTDAGPIMFAATREILETLGEAFTRKASEMPSQQTS